MTNQHPFQESGSSSAGGGGGGHSWRNIVGITSNESEYRDLYHEGSSSCSGGISGQLSSRNVMGLPSFQYGYQSPHPAASSMAHHDIPYYGRVSTATNTSGEQPPNNFAGAAHPNYSTEYQPAYSTITSTSYQGYSSHGSELATGGAINGQSFYATAAPPSISLDTGVVPRSSVDPHSHYHDQYPPQPLENHSIGPHPGMLNGPPDQPPEPQRHGTFLQEEDEELNAMRASDASWQDVAQRLKRSPKSCRQHKRHLDLKEKTEAAARARLQEGYDGPAAWDTVPSLRQKSSSNSHIDWSDDELIEWARNRAQTIINEQRVGRDESWEMVAQELNVKNNKKISGRTLRVRMET